MCIMYVYGNSQLALIAVCLICFLDLKIDNPHLSPSRTPTHTSHDNNIEHLTVLDSLASSLLALRASAIGSCRWGGHGICPESSQTCASIIIIRLSCAMDSKHLGFQKPHRLSPSKQNIQLVILVENN